MPTMREITQRQLRNESGEIMRELDQGESFLVTRNGTPVGELRPIRRRQFVPKAEVLAAFSGAVRVRVGDFVVRY
jgi:prevent-host-death family protein